MHFTCPKSELLAAVQIATRAIPSSSVDATLLTLQMTLNKSGTLTMRSTDNRITVTHEMKVSDFQPGKVAILGNLLVEILQGVQSSRSDDLTFAVNDSNRSTINSADAEYELPGFSGDTFPLVSEIKDGTEFTVAANTLKDLIRKTIIVAPAANTGNANNYEEIHAECKSGEMTFVSTDAVRLSIRTVKVENVPDFKCLIPSSALSELLRTMKTDGDVAVTISADYAAFAFGTTQLRTRLSDKRFPSWAEIIPKTQSRWATVRLKEAQANLKGVLPIAKDQKSQVTVQFEADRIIFECVSPEFGRARREVEATLDGQPITLVFNGRYLLDFLQSVDCETFRWGVSSKQYPGMMIPTGDDSFRYVVMPVTTFA